MSCSGLVSIDLNFFLHIVVLFVISFSYPCWNSPTIRTSLGIYVGVAALRVRGCCSMSLLKKFSFSTATFFTNYVVKKYGKISVLTDGSKYPYVLLFD